MPLPECRDLDLHSSSGSSSSSPGGRQEDDTLILPAKRLIKATTTAMDGQVGAPHRIAAHVA